MKTVKYQIYNSRMKVNIGKPLTCKKRARNKCDKLDNQYGAYCHSIIEVLA